MPTLAATKAEETLIHVLWLNAGLSCDGDFVSLAAASQPSIEEIALGALRGLPQVAAHWPLIDFECGPNRGADDFLEWFFKADRGEFELFVLEGSIPIQGFTETTEVDLWRDLVAQSFPASGWLRLDHQTLAMLTAYRAARGLATSDEAANDLLALAGGMAR